MDDATTILPRYALNEAVSDRVYYAATIVFHPDFSYIGATALLEPQAGCIDISRNQLVFQPLCSPYQGLTLDDVYISRKPLQLRITDTQWHVHLHSDATPVHCNAQVIFPGSWYPFDQQQPLLLELNRRILLYIYRKTLVTEDKQHLGMLGVSDAIQSIRQQIVQVADTPLSVLIQGESGTGKELVARAIHQCSLRAQQPFVAVNTGSIAPSLLASELFGAKKGAFSGATQDKQGFFQQAHTGSLLLDEIGDAHDDIQLALLRALESGQIQPVGAQRAQGIDVRFIAATDADLEYKLAQGQFRTPLWQRLAGYEIRLPPLRERPVDIGLLLADCVQQQCTALQCSHLMAMDNVDLMSDWLHFFYHALHFSWPGNIRQLRNMAQQMVVYNRNNNRLRTPQHIVQQLQGHRLLSVQQTAAPPVKRRLHNRQRQPKDISESELIEAMVRSGYEPKGAAIFLGVSRSAVYKMIDDSQALYLIRDLSNESILNSLNQHQGDVQQTSLALKVSQASLKRRLNENKSH